MRVARPRDVVEGVGVTFKQRSAIGPKTKFPLRLKFSIGLTRWRATTPAILAFTAPGSRTTGTSRATAFTGWWAAHRLHRRAEPLLQFLIHAAQFVRALEPVRGEAESGEHDEENEPVPELQPPADGVENHAQPSMQ